MERKITRREVRDSAFKMVFESLFRDDSVDEILELAGEVDEIILNDEVVKMFRGTLKHASELDEIISKYSEKRQIDRIPKVSVAILRIAIYEILYEDKMPLNVAINEAVLISKIYAQESDVSFVNGVLGEYARNVVQS